VRRAARLDGNHRAIFDAAIHRGRDVIETPELGRGRPDGFVFDPRIRAWHAIEVKRPATVGRRGRRRRDGGALTPPQQQQHSTKLIHIVETEGQLLALLGVWERPASEVL
jgi:hypothetical protein